MYNDESWTPHTFQFPDYDARFRNPISLPLEKDDGENNDVKVPEHVKRDFNDIRSKFKIMHADWKKSGNGAGNRDGVSIRIRGQNYEKPPAEDEQVIFVDDDRHKFGQKYGLHLAYFWCLSEMCGVNQQMTQDCSGTGLSSTSKYLFKIVQFQNLNSNT